MRLSAHKKQQPPPLTEYIFNLQIVARQKMLLLAKVLQITKLFFFVYVLVVFYPKLVSNMVLPRREWSLLPNAANECCRGHWKADRVKRKTLLKCFSALWSEKNVFKTKLTISKMCNKHKHRKREREKKHLINPAWHSFSSLFFSLSLARLLFLCVSDNDSATILMTVLKLC